MQQIATMDAPKLGPNTRNNRTIRCRLILCFYTLITIFAFAYWEVIRAFLNNPDNASKKLVNDDYSGCFTDTLTPWHISYTEEALCTNNRDVPPSVLQHDVSSQNLNEGNNKHLFFASCQKCCRRMLDGGKSHCQCEDVCSTRVEGGLVESYNSESVAVMDGDVMNNAKKGNEITNNKSTTGIETKSAAPTTANVPRVEEEVEVKAEIKLEFEREDYGVMPSWNMRYDNGTFIGAKEWYRHWTRTKNVRREVGDGKNRADLSQDDLSKDHTLDDFVLSKLKIDSPKAHEHIIQMKARYEEINALPDYRVRGLGWIEYRLGMVLNVIVARESVDNESSNGHIGGKVSVFIVDTVGDIKCGRNDIDSGEMSASWMEYHPPLTMWVRANGPEMFAGTALPHAFGPSSSAEDRHRCAWRFDFDTQTSGEYSIYVKALTFNGFADWNKDLCKTKPIQWENISTGNVTDSALQSAIVQQLSVKGNFAHHRGLMAFKNYDKFQSCCEACTRARGCRLWSIPGEIDECELYFEKADDDVDFWDSNAGKYIGRHRDYSYVHQNLSDFPVTRRRLGQSHRRKLSVNRSEVALHKWPNLNVVDSYGYPRGEPTSDFIGCGWSNLKSFER